MVVVSDTSPISGLYRIGHLHLFRILYQKVIIPEAVFQELLELKSFGFDLEEILMATWIEVKSPSNINNVAILQKELDLGEAEAIVLAQELNADLLLMDEAIGRQVAKREGMTVIGLIGMLTDAKSQGYVLMVKPLLDRLISEANFRISPALYQMAVQYAGE